MNVFGASAVATLLLTLALLLLWKRKVPKIVAVLMLAASATIGGLIGQWIGTATDWTTTLFGSVVGGVASAVITLVLAFIVIHDMWPKNNADKKTAFAAFLLPWFAAGGLLAQIVNSIANVVTRAGSAVFGGLL